MSRAERIARARGPGWKAGQRPWFAVGGKQQWVVAPPHQAFHLSASELPPDIAGQTRAVAVAATAAAAAEAEAAAREAAAKKKKAAAMAAAGKTVLQRNIDAASSMDASLRRSRKLPGKDLRASIATFSTRGGLGSAPVDGAPRTLRVAEGAATQSAGRPTTDALRLPRPHLNRAKPREAVAYLAGTRSAAPMGEGKLGLQYE